VSPGAPSLVRRFWPAVASVSVLALLWCLQTLGFAPLATRYRAQLAAAGEIGASLDPALASTPIPPRVNDLLRHNSVAAAEAARLGQSGSLAIDLVRGVSATAVGCGIDVTGSEPGVVTPTAGTLEVRAHLRLRCRYAQLVELLDRLAGQQSLYRIERMAVVPRPDGSTDTELWVARVLLKRGGKS
jgi:hypothetical protein